MAIQVEEIRSGNQLISSLSMNKYLARDSKSLQEICTATKSELDSIEERFPRFWSDFSPTDAAAILKIVSEQFGAVHHLAMRDEGFDQKKYLSQEQMQKVMGMFRELIDNFFPMAHTSTPLSVLRILDDRELKRLWEIQQSSIQNLSMRLNNICHEIDQMKKSLVGVNIDQESMQRILRIEQKLVAETTLELSNLKIVTESMWDYLNP